MRLVSDEQRLECRSVSQARRRQQLIIGGRSSHASGWNVRTHR
jgi:hypothetical protein